MSRPVVTFLCGAWSVCWLATRVAAQTGSAVPPAVRIPAPARAQRAVQGLRAPFQLSPAEQQFVDQVLETWQKQTGGIKTFKVKFEQWKYIPAMGFDAIPQQKNFGSLSFAKPDRGSFEIKEVRRYNGNNENPQWLADKGEVGERWVCDGKNIYQYDHRAKQLKVIPIAKELQGKAIASGPLPFLFGADAADLRHRYWIRSTKSNKQEIWLDVFPKFQADAANYRRVEVILDRTKLLPKAMQVYVPGGDRDVYLFNLDKARINHPLDRLLPFRPPSVPFGWQRKIVTPRHQQAIQPAQARRMRRPGGVQTRR